MRVLIYGINYAPELTGIGKYTGEMASWLASRGHTVKVVTAMPYYPEWEIHKKYRGRLWHKEILEGVTVYRCPLYVPKKLSSLKRIIHEFTFLFGTLPIWLMTFFQKKYDNVICISPPFHLGFLPLIYAKMRRVNLVTHIQDLQVDAAKNLVMIKNGRLLNMMFGAERFILKHSNAVSTISSGMLKRVREKNITEAKTIFFPNWVDIDTIKPLPSSQSLRNEFGLKEQDRVVLYSGNLGEKQGLDILIDVAGNFKERKDIRFLVIGSGGQKESLEKRVRDMGLLNISFHPLVAANRLAALLATADLHLVLQRKSASDLVMPSKLTGILAAGGCSLVTAEPGTSLYEMVESNNLGILVKPESPADLIRALEMALKSDLSTYRKNARHYAEHFLSKESVMKNFERTLTGMLKKKPALVYNQPVTTIKKPNALTTMKES